MHNPDWPADHPVILAVLVLGLSQLCKETPFETLLRVGDRRGAKWDEKVFDEVAALVGMPYCRALDLYVDPDTKARAEALHFTEAHHALG